MPVDPVTAGIVIFAAVNVAFVIREFINALK